MRAIIIAAVCLALAACGGAQTSQANNTQANVSNDSRPPATARASTVVPVSMAPVSGDRAKAVMHERHEGMQSIGKANKAIRDELHNDSPDLDVIRSNAAKIADLSAKASGWFAAGTGPDVGKTGAKPTIWQNPQDFTGKLQTFQRAASAFQSATNGKDLNVMKAKLADLGGACKACHDKYRSEMHH